MKVNDHHLKRCLQTIKVQIHKQSTEGRKYSKEIMLRTIFFISKRQADMLFFKILASRTASHEFSFSYST